MMIRSLTATALALVLAGQITIADGQLPKRQEGPYVFCNVFTSDACFGVAQGDRLEMEVVTDFVLYHVSFSFGRTATIYSGFHPTLSEAPGAKFEKCTRPNGFKNCRRRNLEDGGVEFVASRERESRVLHVIVSKGKDGTPFVDSFLQNIRSCTRSGSTIHCAP